MKNVLNYFLHKKLVFIGVLALLQLILHLSAIRQMPGSVHAWRQCNTLSMSRNFYDESMDIRYPRVDERLDTDGITGSPFPVYEWTLACIYKVFGFNHFYHRWFSFFIFIACLWGMYGLLELFFKDRNSAALGTWAFSFIPEYFYHQVNALPDILALSLMVLGLFFHLKNRQATAGFALFPWILLGLAALVKMQFFIGVLFVLIYEGVLAKNKQLGTKSFMMSVAAGIVCISAVQLWYAHANKLMYLNDLKEYTLDFSWPASISVLLISTINFLISDFPEMILGYALFPFFLAGTVWVLKHAKTPNLFKLPMLVYGLCLLAWFILMNNKIVVHQYYLLVSLPFLVIIATAGIKFLSYNYTTWVAIIILFITPVLAFARIYPSRWAQGKSGIPSALLNSKSREKLSNAIPNSSKCIVGPDPSTTIYFYYLHKKGFCLPACETFSKVENSRGCYLRNYIKRGAQFLIIDNQCLQNDSIMYFIQDTVIVEDGFGVYKIGEK